MIGIYKITNKIDGKIYIGQSVNIQARWKDHKSSLKWDREPASYLYNAMRKHGIENFIFEVIEQCEIDELNEREMFWIKKLNANNKNIGYNLSEGGDHQSTGENNGRAKLTEEDVRQIRILRSQLKTRHDVYDLYKDKITWSGFLDVWQGRRWPHVIVEGAYSDKVEEFQKSLRGGRSQALLTDEEVIKIRQRYVNETVKEIYEDYKDLYSSIKSFELVVHGRSYSHLPIYKKREKNLNK